MTLPSLRAAMHVHSAWSYDAHLALEELVGPFRRHRYDIVFMCEHDREFSQSRWEAYKEACAAVSRDGVLFVPGIEYADPDDRVHVPVWGASDFLGSGLPTSELLRRVDDCGGFAVLAHPARRDAWEIVDPTWLSLLGGIEVWSRKWDGWAPNRRAAGWVAGGSHLPVASLDLHRLNQFFPLSLRLELAGAVSRETAVQALRSASARPQFRRFPVSLMTSPPMASCLAQAERLRRPLVRILRP